MIICKDFYTDEGLRIRWRRRILTNPEGAPPPEDQRPGNQRPRGIGRRREP